MMSSLSLWWAAVLSAGLLAVGCGAKADVSRPAERVATRYKITIEAASIAASREGGRPWHVRKPSGLLSGFGTLVGLGLGQPMLGALLGKAMAGGTERYPPSPYLEMKIGMKTYSTLPAGPTLDPKWGYPIAVDLRDVGPEDEVVLLVRDSFDKGVIGRTSLSVRRLVSRRFHRISSVGQAASLELRVTKLDRVKKHRTFSFVVPGNKSPKQLVGTESQRAWQRIPLLNGDVVRITAQGRVCPSSTRNECFGPVGAEPGRWESHNHEGFEKIPHSSLVGIYANVAVRVGVGTTFVAQRSGHLLLFVNDTDLGNNTGSFNVRVSVNGPGPR